MKETMLSAMKAMVKACNEQYNAKGSCKECPLYDKDYDADGNTDGNTHFCMATYPNMWYVFFPELKGVSEVPSYGEEAK